MGDAQDDHTPFIVPCGMKLSQLFIWQETNNGYIIKHGPVYRDPFHVTCILLRLIVYVLTRCGQSTARHAKGLRPVHDATPAPVSVPE
jgi:hypothetical protein